jgi:voltage-gated potassium channel Kch
MLEDRESRPVFLWAVGTVIVGSLLFRWLEGWSWLDAIYFCVVSLTTVGYGDLTPTRPESKLLAIFYILNGIAVLLALFDRIREVRRRARTWEE